MLDVPASRPMIGGEMRISLKLTIDVTHQSWEEAVGHEVDNPREDLRAYVLDKLASIQSSPMLGAFARIKTEIEGEAL